MQGENAKKLRNLKKKCRIFSVMPTELLRKQFLLTDAENEIIEKKAESAGMSVSNLTRKLYGLKPLEKGRKQSIIPKKEKGASAPNE